MKKYLFFLVFVCSQVVGQTVLFQQDFNGVGPFESTTPNNEQFNSFTTYTNSSSASLSIDNSQLKLTSNGGAYCYPPYYNYCIATTGTASANRTTSLSNNPYVLLHHKFSLSLNADAGYPGSGSSASFSFKFDSFARTANSAAGGGNTFTINNIEYDMNISKSIEVFANNTSISQLYTAPNGNNTTLTSGSYDIWVNNDRVKTATINNPQSLLSEFTFSTSAYSRAGITAKIDDVLFEVLANESCNSQIQPSIVGQYTNTIFNKTFGSSNAEADNSNQLDKLKVVPTSDGGYILASTSSGGISGDKTEIGSGDSDYWIVKINSSGEKVWDKTYGGDSNEDLLSIISTTDGGFLLGGVSYSNISGDKSENSRGQYDYWIIKINAAGVKQWDKTYGGDLSDYLLDMVNTNDGGYLLAGTSYSNISGEKTENNKGINNYEGDYWVVKIDANGVKQWDKTYGGTGSDDFRSLINTTDGGYLLAGYSINGGGTADITDNNRGSYDYWIIKISALGIKQWNKLYGGAKSDYLSKILQTDDGYLLAGSSDSDISSEKSENNKGFNDFWVIKIDNYGIKQWDKTFGGSEIDNLSTITKANNGDFLLGGTSSSGISGNKSEVSRGSVDFWIVGINSTGTKEFDKTIGGTNYDKLGSIIWTANNNIIIGGISDSNISGEKTENSKGYSDYWVLKFTNNPTTSSLQNSPMNISYGASISLKASPCTGGVITWSNGQTINPLVFTAPESGTFNYSATCTSYGCTSTPSDDFVISINPTINPCPNTLIINDNFTTTPNPSLKKASVSITATNQITGNGTNVTYQAGNKVELNAGFKADNGTVFLVQIAGCN